MRLFRCSQMASFVLRPDLALTGSRQFLPFLAAEHIDKRLDGAVDLVF